MASRQAQAQGDWDVGAQVKMIFSAVEESQKVWNDPRSDRDPTLRPGQVEGGSLSKAHVKPGSRRHIISVTAAML